MSSDQRPKFSPEIARQAAQSIVDDLINHGHVEERHRDGSVDDIVKHGRQYKDGYELAKALEDWSGWGCSFQTAEVLDGFGCAVSSALDKAEKEWAARTSPQPPFPVGTRVVLPRGEAGVIDGVYAHGAAKYLVKVDGDKDAAPPTCSRRIINFEDAKPEAEAA